MKPSCPRERIVRAECLIRNRSRSPWVDVLEDIHDAVVVREIVVRRTDRICCPTGGQRNASGNLWVRLFHQTLDIAEFLHERAGCLEGIAAKACDARH